MGTCNDIHQCMAHQDQQKLQLKERSQTRSFIGSSIATPIKDIGYTHCYDSKQMHCLHKATVI